MEQQSPVAQQKPFWQWLLMHWLFALQASPLAPSDTHMPPMQFALVSHCESFVQLVPHAGADCVADPLQKRSAYVPQAFARVPAVHALSSSISGDMLQTKPLQTASLR